MSALYIVHNKIKSILYTTDRTDSQYYESVIN